VRGIRIATTRRFDTFERGAVVTGRERAAVPDRAHDPFVDPLVEADFGIEARVDHAMRDDGGRGLRRAIEKIGEGRLAVVRRGDVARRACVEGEDAHAS
jgi:hypothetical protein